ncbi:MAG: hypothetical protein ACREAQ_09390 [Nitrososphaera sp.]
MNKENRNRRISIRDKGVIEARCFNILIAVALISASLVFSMIGPVFAAATTITTSSKFDINIFVFVPCADGGAGELVRLSGSLHDLFHVTDTGKGKFILHFHDNPQGVVGTGLSTGDKYQGTGVTRGTEVVASGVAETFVNNFKIIGKGTDNNFRVHENFHMTVNPDGTVTAFHDNFSVECQ